MFSVREGKGGGNVVDLSVYACVYVALNRHHCLPEDETYRVCIYAFVCECMCKKWAVCVFVCAFVGVAGLN